MVLPHAFETKHIFPHMRLKRNIFSHAFETKKNQIYSHMRMFKKHRILSARGCVGRLRKGEK